MTEPELNTRLQTITPPDEAARAAAHAHWTALAKPLGGLGSLETMLEDAAALTGTPELDFARRAVLVLCADNGVVAQGVSQTDASVTRAVLQNLAARRTSVCQMAAAAHCSVVPVDMGIAGAPVPGVQDCRIAPGTKDFTCGPAMTRAQAVQAIGCGIALVRGQKQQGVQLLATGEMGIGNTTTSSAVASVLLGRPVQEMTGRGAGLSDEGLRRKIDAIRRGIVVNRPDAADPLGVLAALGGFDIAGLCGVFLGGASYWATISKLISHFSISSICISVRLRNLYSWSISPLKNVIKSGSPSKLNVTGLPFFTVTVLTSKLTLLSVTTPTSIAVSSFNSLSHEARDSPAKAIVIKLLYIVFISFSF